MLVIQAFIFAYEMEKKTSERIFPVKFHSQAEIYKGRSGRDHMVVEFITTYIVCNRCPSPLT